MSKKTFLYGMAIAVVLGVVAGTGVAYVMVKPYQPYQSMEATDE